MLRKLQMLKEQSRCSFVDICLDISLSFVLHVAYLHNVELNYYYLFIYTHQKKEQIERNLFDVIAYMQF